MKDKQFNVKYIPYDIGNYSPIIGNMKDPDPKQIILSRYGVIQLPENIGK